jgi:hypothetical protein
MKGTIMSTAAPAVSKPLVTLAGSASSALIEDLKAVAEVTSASAAGTLGDAVVVDGSTTAALDENLIRGALDGNALVGIASPTAAHLKTIQKLTGSAPGGTPRLVTVRKSKNGKGYDTTCLSPGKITGKGDVDLAPPPQQNLSVGSALQTALHSQQPVGDAISQLGAPSGAYSGVSRQTNGTSWTSVSLTCDKNGSGKTQTNNQSYYSEAYVYWVNGGTNAAYYIVICRVYGSVTAGTPAGSVVSPLAAASEGYTNTYATIGPMRITDSNGNPYAGCTRVDYSPGASDVPANGVITTQTSQTMVLGADTDDGNGAIKIVAAFQDPVSNPGWGVNVNTGSLLYPGWTMYQHDGFNFGVPNSNFYALYDSSDNVFPYPSTSFYSVNFDALAVWQITDPSFPSQGQFSAPVSLPVQLSGYVDHGVMQIHGRKGCTTNNNHQLYFDEWVGWSMDFDLADVANLQNNDTGNS